MDTDNETSTTLAADPVVVKKGPSKLEKARGTKWVRLLVISILILIVLYMLYSMSDL